MGRQSFSRVDRVKKALIKEISDIINHKIKDPLLADKIISVTDVDLSNDLRYAKVFVSVLGDTETREEILEILVDNQGLVRQEVARRVNLRYVPEIEIHYDDSLERGSRVTQLLEKIAQEEK